MLDIAVAGGLNVGFGTKMIDMDPEAVKEVGTSSMALPGVSDGGAHTKFVTTARFATEVSGTGSASTRSCRSRRRTGAFPDIRRWRAA